MAEYVCPRCGKPIDDDEALLCLYCGENLERGVGVLGKMKYSSHWVIIAAITIFVIVAFILLMCL
ncbi:MAG: zinc-ribbon domain-containing protein [Candidatus Omnitrophica bacterium]|nr:zinc-ribbon domain-containing protein [Candidatus Omnitrophota bacterium]